MVAESSIAFELSECFLHVLMMVLDAFNSLIIAQDLLEFGGPTVSLKSRMSSPLRCLATELLDSCPLR
jgi:hypothetical protein